ncbi:solute carrier family 25 member 3-like [Onthophagus taurus]|uniref:solute carrier family 25 member 3-like n=1 Tax=Onthophagus taurus TaxID=166361 RepID=UPI0039BE7439
MENSQTDLKETLPNEKLIITWRQIGAASAVQLKRDDESCAFGSNKYFALCGLGGLVACGLTHTLIISLDIVKCRLQVDPGKYKNIINGFQLTLAEEGYKGLVKGWAPTFFGYSLQGAAKFGFYELFKVVYSGFLSEENYYLYRTFVYLAASATAECIADVALCPFESMKVKIQTIPGYAGTMRKAIPKMKAEEGIKAFYKSLVPLWLRQIPYTMVKFSSFERILELLYQYAVPKPRAECTAAEQLIVTFSAGYIAGIFCAIASHPADTIVSKLNQEPGLGAMGILNKLGFVGVWKGLFPRIIMIGTLTAAQWFIYDGFKVLVRLPRPPPMAMPESLKKKQSEHALLQKKESEQEIKQKKLKQD